MRVDFNIMSNSAIYKKPLKSLKKRYSLFYFQAFVFFTSAEKVLYEVFTRNLPTIVRDHVKVYI